MPVRPRGRPAFVREAILQLLPADGESGYTAYDLASMIYRGGVDDLVTKSHLAAVRRALIALRDEGLIDRVHGAYGRGETRRVVWIAIPDPENTIGRLYGSFENFLRRRSGEQEQQELRARLAKILGMLGSAHEGERDNAAVMAAQLQRESGLTWDEMLNL